MVDAEAAPEAAMVAALSEESAAEAGTVDAGAVSIPDFAATDVALSEELDFALMITGLAECSMTCLAGIGATCGISILPILGLDVS